MSLTVKDIYEATHQRFHLELAAGTSGLTRPMNWVYVLEDYTISNFLHGNELIITTGVMSGGQSSWLLDMLHHIIQAHTCGLIINEGPYLNRKQISQDVLNFCNENHFPLFLMPWRIHIYDVTRDYCDRIFTDAQHRETLHQAFNTLLDPQADHRQALQLLADNNFSPAKPCWAVLFHMGSTTQPNLLLQSRLHPLLWSFDFPAFLLIDHQHLIFICQPEHADDVRRAAETLQKHLPVFFSHPLPAGIGGQSSSLSLLSHSVKQAQAALLWAQHQGYSLASYDDMGFFRLLLEINDHERLTAYVQELLGPVQDYDSQHQSALTHTLYLYLIHKGSIKDIADAAFCHRNTVAHRLHLLKDKLGYQLDDPMTCFQLLSAFQVAEYLTLFVESPLNS